MWPAMGFLRLARYYRHRMGRLKESPSVIASGFACGIAISFTPFVGFHLMLGGVMAWLMGGSLVAMLLGTVVAGNPWVLGIILVTIYKTGKWMLGEKPHINKVPVQADPTDFWHVIWHKPQEILLPMTLGCLPFFVLSWIISYYVVRDIIAGYKEARHRRIHKIKENKK